MKHRARGLEPHLIAFLMAAITSRLSREELESLFDYNFYLQHVDASFQRLGL